jgi:hypothetical protein
LNKPIKHYEKRFYSDSVYEDNYLQVSARLKESMHTQEVPLDENINNFGNYYNDDHVLTRPTDIYNKSERFRRRKTVVRKELIIEKFTKGQIEIIEKNTKMIMRRTQTLRRIRKIKKNRRRRKNRYTYAAIDKSNRIAIEHINSVPNQSNENKERQNNEIYDEIIIVD